MTRLIRAAAILAACVLPHALACEASMGPAHRAGIVTDASIGSPAQHGLMRLEEALRTRGLSVRRVNAVAARDVDFLVVAGVTSSEGPAARILSVLDVALPEGPEALVIRRTEIQGKPAIVLCGSDARGLMYAALDAADRISWADDPFVVTITSDFQPPHVELERVKRVTPGENLAVRAKVWDPSGIKWVRLRYRHLTQFEDYETEDMKYNAETGLWSATIPGAFIGPTWDLMYFVEAVDGGGNGRMYPDMEMEMPYVVVEVDR